MKFNLENDVVLKKIEKSINAPWVMVYVSPLGRSIIIKFSMEPKDKWQNGIFENSTYAIIIADNKQVLEKISGYGLPKMRKGRYKDVNDLINKINKFIERGK